MNIATELARPQRVEALPVLTRLHAATAADQQRLEERLHAVERFADPRQRGRLIRRYASLHVPAEAVLAPHLSEIPDLDFEDRRRGPKLMLYAGSMVPAFPAPASVAEALGMLYALEALSLGGRTIPHDLSKRGVSDERLNFLDHYGSAAGDLWRSLLSVIARETGDNQGLVLQACRGGIVAFRHAERVLCGEG